MAMPSFKEGIYHAVTLMSGTLFIAIFGTLSHCPRQRQALHSMKSVLREGGILVFDQGQTDATMKNPPKFDAVINNRDWTRFFVLEYPGEVMTVNIFDFIHTESTSDFRHAKVHVRIRLQDSWIRILKDAGLSSVKFLENWDGTPYNKETSRRMIVISTK
jgi:glycine/sarcosine N-methyltransferase